MAGVARLGTVTHALLMATVVSGLLAGTARAADDPVVADAAANVKARSGPQNVWDGPTQSPKPLPGKKIVYLSSNGQNDASREWGDAIKESAGKLGWEVTFIDGLGSPKTWIEGYNQAVALKPDGIVTDADIASMQDAVKAGAEQGIVLVGIHGTAFPGPNPDLGIFYNIQQDPRDIGKAQADWIIADSDGKARVVVTTHCEYQIACTKAKATEDRIRACKGCEVLEVFNSPISEVAQRQPAAVTAWVQKYGTPLYITSVADYTADYQVPALRAGGVADGEVILVSADGNRSAYERIRAGGQFQRVTASEPYKMQGYQAVDELNRAFNKQPPSGWVTPPYLVTPENVDAEGGDQNTFIPSNGYAQQYEKIWGLM